MNGNTLLCTSNSSNYKLNIFYFHYQVVKEGVEKKLKDYKPEIWFGGVLADGTTVNRQKSLFSTTF